MAESIFAAEAARSVIKVNGVNIVEFNQNGNIYMLGAGGLISTPNLSATTITGTTINGGTFNTTSDIRLKENIEDITDAVAKVEGLRGVYFTMIADPTRRHVGLIAQETADVLPEAVVRRSDDTLGVEYGNIVGLLVEAIKEQQRQINELKAMIAALSK